MPDLGLSDFRCAPSGSCDATEVARLRSAGTEVELTIAAAVVLPAPFGTNGTLVEHEWTHHLTDNDRQTLSVVLYDPASGAKMVSGRML